MPNIDKIRIVDEIQGTTQDYGLGVTASQDDIELPIDYNSVYDTEEHQVGYYTVTGGYKPLYRKTYVITTPSSLSTITNVGELPSGYEIIYIKDAFIIGTDAVEKLNVPDSTATKAWLRLSNNTSNPNKIALSIGANHLLNRTGYITLEYTKTTDEIVEEIPQQTIPSYVRTYLDTVPVGTELDYDGETVPEGYEEVEEEKDVYSTDEVKTNKVWIDGKPIYRKVFTFTTVAGSGTIISNIPNFDNLVELSGSYKIDNDNQVPPNFYYDSSHYFRTWASRYNLQDDSINLYYACAFYAGYTGNIIVEYTKTTDQGGNA